MRPGKRIRVKDRMKTPRSFTGSYLNTQNSKRFLKNHNPNISGRTKFLITDLGKADPSSTSNNDAFGIWLRKNAITTLKFTLNSTATLTSVPIRPPSEYGGGDYLLRKGDTFYIYCQFTYRSIKLTADADLMHSSTILSITSTSFIKGRDTFRDGAFIIFDNKVVTERISNAPQLKRFDLTNSAYRALNSTPLTLLTGETGKLHIPLNVTIILTHGGIGADEMTSADLYVGHSATSTIAGNYWASMDRAFYRARNHRLFQLSPGIYGAGASTDFSRIATKSVFNDGRGRDLKLYTTANFTSTTNTIKVILYYKTIVI